MPVGRIHPNVTSDTGTIWKAELIIDENSEILNEKRSISDSNYRFWWKPKKSVSVIMEELTQNIIADEDLAENLTKNGG